MNKTKIFCRSLALAFGLISAFVIGEPTTLESKMSAEEFTRSGLDKLTQDELEYLGNWIRKQRNTPTSIKHAENSSTLDRITPEEAQAVLDRPLNRKIDGEFRGWNGKTIFKMKNGEIWRQRLGGKYFKKLSSPDVILRKSDLGFYEMEILETSRKVGVTRIK